VDNATGILRNMSDGGEGAEGRTTIITDEWKRKISNTLKGHVYSKDRNKKISLSLTGRTRKQSECDAISNGLKGRQSPTLGIKHTEETKSKISESKLGTKRKYLPDGSFIMVKK
jgi:hypothetical protein